MAKEGKEVSDREPQTVVGGVTPTMLMKTVKSCNTIENTLSVAKGDKSAALERFKDAGGNKRSLKRAISISNAEPDVGKNDLECQLEYLKHLGFITDYKIKFAQADMFEDRDGDEDEPKAKKGAAKPKEVGEAQGKAFAAAHAH